jgi:hypothetical protein
VGVGSRPRAERAARRGDAKAKAFNMYATGASVEQVAAAVDRAPSTAWTYLYEFVSTYPARPLDPWLDEATYQRITAAAKDVERPFLKPIFDCLGGTISYEHIRLALARFQIAD